MSRGSGRAKTPEANPTTTPETELSSAGALQDDQQKLTLEDPHNVLEGLSPEEAVGSSMGAPNDYPYLDKSAIPVHERHMQMNSVDGPSQADLNPAFSAKPADGGRYGEGVIEGTELNANELALAAAENSGEEGAVEAVEEQIAEGAKQQIDAEAVTQAAQDRAPAGIDASTGRKEGEATAPGAPSGMESQTKLGSNDDAKGEQPEQPKKP